MTEKTGEIEETKATPEAEPEKPKPIEHKIGLHRYAMNGTTDDGYLVIGAPRVRGDRWVTVAHEKGGQVASWPEKLFETLFWIPNPTVED
ncbi:hypothetical protein SEA_JACKO_76 [Microbacterium phage Jacko]|nr:hypothetical protein SEA_JACKO_76 [Microbacterium phage Jacko]